MRFKLVGRKLFDPKKSSTIRSFEIWPGYQTCFNQLKVGDSIKSILNIDLVHKVITNENVLNKMEEIRQRFHNNFEGAISQEFIGKSVMTQYNRRIYRVDRIDYNKTPQDGFTNEKGEFITFLDYY